LPLLPQHGGEIVVFEHPGDRDLHELPCAGVEGRRAAGAGAGKRATGEPIPWVQIHKMPDYVYFNHSAHVNRGISCVECHGRINLMDEVYHAKPLSMSFCLDCHRDPARRVRPLDKITDLGWKASSWDQQLAEMGTNILREWHVQSLQNCSTCHR
jgi:hypothetical protein